MTYCVAMRLDRGLVFMADTRTNAGVDDVSQARKVQVVEVPGERAIVLLSAGNLATTQAVINLLKERVKAPKDRSPSILTAPSMYQIANVVGDTLRDVIRKHDWAGHEHDASFSASLILGGQIKGQDPRLFLIYPEGNFIEATDDSPFFQIGETKYGRPILVRGYDPKMSFEEAIRMLMLSFDSTIRANIAVDLPIDLVTIERDQHRIDHAQRIERNDPYFNELSARWSKLLREGMNQLPPFTFEPTRPVAREA